MVFRRLMKLAQVPQTCTKYYKAIYISIFFISKMKMGSGVDVKTVRIRIKDVPDGHLRATSAL